MNTRSHSFLSLKWLIALLALFALTSAPAEDRFFVSNGVRLRYVVEGQGPPVVLIHGFNMSLLSSPENIMPKQPPSGTLEEVMRWRES